MKTYIKYLFGVILAVVATACYDDPGSDILFSDEPTLEFVGSEVGTQGLYTRINDGNGVTDNFTVNLIAPLQSQPVSFTFEVNSLTTAIEGIHFDFPDGKTFSIPAGSLSIEVPFIVYDDEIEPDDKLQIVVSLVSSSANISSNYKELVHQIRVVCPSDLAGSYNSVTSGTTPGGAYSNVQKVITLTASGTGKYLLNDMSFGVYTQIYGDASPTGSIFDICEVISGDPANKDQYNDPFTMNGSINSGTGVITITWSNTFGDTGTSVLTPQ